MITFQRNEKAINKNLTRQETMVIETERLLLREMTDDDFQALYKAKALKRH